MDCLHRLTTASGNQYLAHSGPGYGKSSDAVLVDARHMSIKWSDVGKPQDIGGKHK